MNFKLLTIGLLLLPWSIAKSQTKPIAMPKDSVVYLFKDSISDFSVDSFNQPYFVINDEYLYSIKDKNPLPFSHSNRLQIQNLNTKNPFLINYTTSLYQLYFLDNELNPTKSAISLISTKTFDPNLIAVVDNNWLWGYDRITQKLVLWDYTYQKVLQETVQIQPKDSSETFTDLMYDNGKLYLISNERILRFNRFGQLTRTYPFKEHHQVKWYKNYVLFSQNNKLFAQNLNDNTITPLPLKSAVDFFDLNGNTLFVLHKKVVYIYDFEPILQ